MSEVQYRASVISCSGADKYEERKRKGRNPEKHKFSLSFVWLLSELDLPLTKSTLGYMQREGDGEQTGEREEVGKHRPVQRQMDRERSTMTPKAEAPRGEGGGAGFSVL